MDTEQMLGPESYCCENDCAIMLTNFFEQLSWFDDQITFVVLRAVKTTHPYTETMEQVSCQ